MASFVRAGDIVDARFDILLHPLTSFRSAFSCRFRGLCKRPAGQLSAATTVRSSCAKSRGERRTVRRRDGSRGFVGGSKERNASATSVAALFQPKQRASVLSA